MKKSTKNLRFTLVSVLVLAASFFIMKYSYTTFYKAAYPLGYSKLVDQFCTEFNMPKDLAYAVIHTESGFNPMAQSHVGAKGLMQLMPDTFDWTRYKLGISGYESEAQLHQPEVNLKYGIATLSFLVKEFGDSSAALAAYHAGRGSVNKWLKDERYSSDGKVLTDIPFKETKAYVKKIERTRNIYCNIYGF